MGAAVAAPIDYCPLPLRLARCRLTEALTLRPDFMARGVRDFVALDLRRAVDHAFQLLQHRGIRFAAIGLGAFLLIPQADRDCLVAVGSDEGDLILEPGLAAQQG